MNKTVDHITVGGPSVPVLAPIFPYIHGVVNVSLGKTITDQTPILDIAFDTIEVTEEKLLTALFAMTLLYKTTELTVYDRDTDKILTSNIPEDIRVRVKKESLGEYSFYQTLEPLPFPITGILAKPSEASPFQQTDEGARKALRETKRALLNLLEDAREAEETVRAQASNLEEALIKTRALADARANFISTASHQLRTPLTTMRWFTEMLMGGDVGEVPKAAHDYIVQISQGIIRMVSLVNLLLRMARIESKRVVIKPIEVHIQEAIAHAVEKNKDLFAEKAQVVDFNYTSDPIILLDPEFIDEVLVNLFENASHYSPAGSNIQIRLSEEGSDTRVDIVDQGIGIKESDAPRVFEKFFRSEEAIATRPDGSGLGLSYAKAIVDEWGGKIWFSRNADKGTTFSFTVPIIGMKEREGEVRLSE